jgi:hypothetical protein
MVKQGGMDMRKKRRLFLSALGVGLAALLCFEGGCQTGALLVGVFGSPTRSEKTVPAEYDLSGKRQPGIVVLVDQPGWLITDENLRMHITRSLNDSLAKKLDMPAELLFDYARIAESRSASAGALSPVETGRSLGADMVLLVILEDFSLRSMPDSDYLKGFLRAQAALLDCSSGEKLWPGDGPYGKAVMVGFEVETGGRKAAVKALSRALAHCVTRYFYDCPVDKFTISYDRTGEAWENWGR